MPVSTMSPTRVITILSLVALCILSFTVLFGSHYNLDTPARDTLAHDSLFSLRKSNVVHQRRAHHHARASSVPVSESIPTPSQSAPTEASTQPFSSPSPSSSSQPSATQDNSSSPPSSSPAISSSPATSAASASSSAPLSSTLSPSSSLSSNARASSSAGVISSTVGTKSNIVNSPTTSFVDNPVSYTSGLSGTRPTNPGSTVSVGATPGVGGATSGFFNNKAAVGVTFSIVGILGGLAVIMTVLTMMKRRRRGRRGRYAIEDEEFFEKYPSGDLNEPVPHLPPGFGTGSATPSIMDVNMSAAPIDAYPDRAFHYGQSSTGAVLDPVDYGIAYPPGAADNNNSTPPIQNDNTSEESGSEYSLHSTSHPFADPVNTSGPTAAPPVRPFAGRAQEMVTTDSYYGPNSAGVGAGGVGYAQ